MAQRSLRSLASAVGAVVLGAAGLCASPSLHSAFAAAPEPEPHAAQRIVCLGEAATREDVKAHHLMEPYAALKSAAAQRKAEAIKAKLCHYGDDFVYEITLLHRDGRLVRIWVDAATGKAISLRPAHEPPSKP